MVEIFLNPSSGRNRGARNRKKLEALLIRHGIPYRMNISESAGHFRELIRNAPANRILAGAGGDSTLAMLLNETLSCGKKNPVAMIGLGSQDDIVREYGFSDLDTAVRNIKRNRILPVDLGVIRDAAGRRLSCFPGQANAGLGALVTRHVAESRQRGSLLPQVLAGFQGGREAFRKKRIPLRLTLEADGQKISGDFHVALFSKIRYWGGGRLFLPEAKLDDGLLHILLVRAMDFRGICKIWRQASRGLPAGLPGVLTLTAREVSLSSADGFCIQTDGEILAAGNKKTDIFTYIRLSVLPRAVPMVR